MASQLYRYNSRLLYYGMALIKDYDFDRGYDPLFGTNCDLTMSYEEHLNDLDTLSAKVLKETLTRCRTKGVIPILVFTPTYRIDKYEHLAQYQELTSICKEVDIPLIEDLFHTDQLMKKELFKDCPHLNDDGAHIFTGMLIEKIDSIMADKNSDLSSDIID